MWHAVPVKDLLLLLCSDAVVLVEEIEETTLWLFEGGIGARLQVTKVGENTLLEFLGVLDWSAKGLESERKASDNVGTRDVKEIVPIPLLTMRSLILSHNYIP